jgi:hypothetical protein
VRATKNLLARNYIAGVVEDGLVRSVNGAERVARWATVTAISATVVPHNGRTIFVMGIGFDDGRTMVLGEVERAWPGVVEALPLRLRVEAFSDWGPRLLADPAAIDLYLREQSAIN